MFKAQIQQSDNATELFLGGRLVGLWAESVMSLATPCSSLSRLLVGLTDVTYVDASGEEVPEWLWSIGAEFTVESCYSREVCERLLLPLGHKSRSTA